MPLPLVAIIGRPNVGKSTLFNRISRSKAAITDDTPGVTRDRHYRKVEWAGRFFIAIDTGGFVPSSDELFESKIREQVEIAIAESELILFLVDAQVGAADIDKEIAKILLRMGKPTLLVANKADNVQYELEASSLYSLGLGEPFAISAIAGRNIGDLLDKVVSKVPVVSSEQEPENVIRVAVIGRPNVGKSSLVNKLLGSERLIVTGTPGTTRDSVDTELEYEGKRIVLIDTAGLRRTAKVKDNLEFYTSLRTIRSLQRADIAIVLAEAPEGVTGQDIKIIEQAEEERKGIIVVVNKWDLVEKTPQTADEFTATFRQRAGLMRYIPLVFVSALTGQRLTRVLDTVLLVYAEREKRLATAELNEFLQEAVRDRAPAARGGQYVKFYYVTQTEISPPTFLFFVNHPEYLDRSYLRYLENRLRERFGFEGTSLRLKFKKRS